MPNNPPAQAGRFGQHPHRWQNIGDTEGRLLFVVTPGGFEGFFVEIAGLTEISPEIVGGIERKYGSYWDKELPA